MICRTFSVDVEIGGGSSDRQTKTVDLVAGGSERYVNKENREEFVRLFVEFDVYR